MDVDDHGHEIGGEREIESRLEAAGSREIDHSRLDKLRRGRGEVQEHVIDEFIAGNISRRDFLRHGTKVGLSLPLLGAILAACGSSSSGTTSTTGAPSSGKSGATIRAGILVPAAYVSPVTVEDTGGLETLDQVGEFLVYTDPKLVYHPWLATKWSSNPDATVWSFTIRQGVKFNDGTPMTVDDVIYSFKSLSNPKTGGNALSIFGGLLTPDGVVKKDSETVEFHLEQADGSFVDAVSNDNYNMIIVPNGTDFSKYEKTMPGTGRFMMTQFSPSTGATFVRNPHYWGTPAKPSKLEFVFYPSETPMTAALEAGDIDCNDGFSIAVSPQLANTSLYNVNYAKAALHRELSMRNDIAPFNNKYVRQAIALTLNRPEIVTALFKGYATIGNDSPFAPVFPATVGPPAVPQRVQNIPLAKQLLAKGGVPNGFSTPFYTETTAEMPHFAEIVKAAAAEIGVTINLIIETPSKYYGPGTFGKSDWLDGEMSLVDYGGRAVPNLYLQAPLQSINPKTGQGAWNAARFNNPTYDKLSKEFIATVDLSSQRVLAKQIELLLLDETPIIYAYFYDVLWATQKNVQGTIQTGQGSMFFWNATKS